METVTVESIPIVIGREEDGRWWADIESMPRVMAYGDTRDLVGAQKLVHILNGAYGIVPTTKYFVGNEVELAHFRV